VCKTIKQLAAADHGNVYELWDKHKTMGCECDAGFYGPDCSQKECKHGVDPLYLDDVATIKYSIFDVAILATNTDTKLVQFTDGQNVQKQGYWALKFYDYAGEKWATQPIAAGADCTEVVAALERLPNNVIPLGQTYCTRSATKDAGEYEGTIRGIDAQSTGRNDYHISPVNRQYYIAYNISFWDADPLALDPFSAIVDHHASYERSTVKLFGWIYRLKFYGNPGYLREPEVLTYLDGKRPSIIAKSGATRTATALTIDETVITKVWTDGQQGEDNDYFADHCNGVNVQIGRTISAASPIYSYLTGFTATEKKLLMACLGSSDFDTSNNGGVYNWDYGSILYPHIIKLVRSVTTYNDGGYYAVVWYDTSVSLDNLGGSFSTPAGTFKLLNPITPPDGYLTDNYEVFTTQGTLALTSNYSEVAFSFASKTLYMTNITADIYNDATVPFDGDISCEIGNNNAFKSKYIFHCLNKGDLFTFLNWEDPANNPPHINLYTAQRLIHSDILFSVNQRFQHVKVSNTNPKWGKGYDPLQYMTHSITTDFSTNWAASVASVVGPSVLEGPSIYRVYKFFPAAVSTYNYVAECSNRGICDASAGTCKCFPGYTSDDCSEQSSIAL